MSRRLREVFRPLDGWEPASGDSWAVVCTTGRCSKGAPDFEGTIHRTVIQGGWLGYLAHCRLVHPEHVDPVKGPAA